MAEMDMFNLNRLEIKNLIVFQYVNTYYRVSSRRYNFL